MPAFVRHLYRSDDHDLSQMQIPAGRPAGISRKDDGRRMESFGGPSWTCASIEARISVPHKINLRARCTHAENQDDLPLPDCMKLPVIWRM